MTVEKDISESLPYDLSNPAPSTAFEPTSIAYDFIIDNIPFLASISNQAKYVRQTAQYRKDQFDNSADPGEQSLSGWWLRSQISFHNGAGIGFYEPGTDAQHTTHRFHDSRGVDVWTEGEAKPLKEVFHAYTGAHNLCGCSAYVNASTDALITGDSAGALKKVRLNGDNSVTGTAYETTYTLNSGHTSSNPFYSVTSDGSHFYALCDKALHRGHINNTTSDIVLYGNQTVDTEAFVKYGKGYVFLGNGRNLYRIDTSISSSANHNTGGTNALPTGINLKTHSTDTWKWNDLAPGTTHLYVSGHSGNVSEIWSIGFDGSGTDSGMSTTSLPNLPGAVMAAQLPFGEVVNAIEYYLGFLVIGTSKGIRIATTDQYGGIQYGPLLFEDGYPITGIEVIDRFAYCATKVDGADGYTNACLVRVDLSQDFGDGTFAYAYDLEYRSSEAQGDETPASSGAVDVFLVDGRLVMLVEEDEDSGTGELQVESLNTYRDGAWLTTGFVRFGMLEPKYFRSVSIRCATGENDSIDISITDQNGVTSDVARITDGLSNYDNIIVTPATEQERVRLTFTFNNATTDSSLPLLQAWQLKAIPATRRQRLIQIPLSCFDMEQDKYNQQFGYAGRAYEALTRLETLEETGKFIEVQDYRTGETFTGTIEEVQFLGESSPDKNNGNFGGLVTVTIRKI